MRALTGQKSMFYQSIKQKKCVLLFFACKIYILKQIKKPKLCITLSAARVFCISLAFSNIHRVLLQCNTLFRLLYLLNTSIVNKKFVRFCFCAISGIIKVFVQLL